MLLSGRAPIAKRASPFRLHRNTARRLSVRGSDEAARQGRAGTAGDERWRNGRQQDGRGEEWGGECCVDICFCLDLNKKLTLLHSSSSSAAHSSLSPPPPTPSPRLRPPGPPRLSRPSRTSSAPRPPSFLPWPWTWPCPSPLPRWAHAGRWSGCRIHGCSFDRAGLS